MTLQEIEEYKQMVGKKDKNGHNEYISLFGYTSTSLDQNVALNFAWENATSGHQKVLFHIKWNENNFHYFLNAGAYDEEKEVLLYDGTRVFVYSVEDVLDKDQNKLHTKIVLGTKAPKY